MPDIRRYPESTCRGKVAYRGRSEARAALRSMTSRGRRDPRRGVGHITEEYRCEYCNYWHVGHRLDLTKRRSRS